nr:hypothetical protein [Maliibacterium massiliense]
MSIREQIMQEVRAAFLSVPEAQLQSIAKRLLCAHHIFMHAKGRVLPMFKAFCARASALGLPISIVGDMTTPKLVEGDVFICGVSSGEPSSSRQFFTIARQCGAYIISFVADAAGEMTQLSDEIIHIEARTMNLERHDVPSAQPMCSTFEQNILLTLDYLVLLLARQLDRNIAGAQLSCANLY